MGQLARIRRVCPPKRFGVNTYWPIPIVTYCHGHYHRACDDPSNSISTSLNQHIGQIHTECWLIL